MDIFFLLIGLAIGFGLGFLLAKNKKAQANTASNERNFEVELAQAQTTNTNNKERIQDLEKTEIELRQEIQHLISERSTLKEREISLQKRNEEYIKEKNELTEKFNKEFELIAAKLLDQKSEKFVQQNKVHMDAILSPLKEKIKSFEEKVERNFNDETKQRTELKTELLHLMKMNEKLSDDAINLTRALKGDKKTQGNWGELQLERILEYAGLQKGIQYTTQGAFEDEDGKKQLPDCIVLLPEDKNFIIDSKVSLVAYEKYFSAETEEEKNIHLKEHISNLKNHIKELSNKRYHDIYEINTPDYVLMFVPIEPAFNLALMSDPELFAYAIEKNIVLVTTSTLTATMKTVSFIWKQENQRKNVLEIARQGGALYNKFVGFTEDLLKVGKQMDGAKKSYEEAMNKLSTGKGNLITGTEKLKTLGVKTEKQINTNLVQRSAEQLSAPDE